MSEDNSWRNLSFRQSIMNKINETIKTSGIIYNENSASMENHIFSKARNKDEYLSFVARLIIHVRELSSKNVNSLISGNDITCGVQGATAQETAIQGRINNNSPVIKSGEQNATMMSNQKNMFGGSMISLDDEIEDDAIFVEYLEIKQENFDPDLCCICLNQNVNSVLIPCGHLTLCYGCAELQSKRRQNRCPICQTDVKSFIKTYKP